MDDDPVLEIADRYVLTLERTLMRAFGRARDAANVAAFERAIARKDFNAAMSALNLETLENELYGESR